MSQAFIGKGKRVHGLFPHRDGSPPASTYCGFGFSVRYDRVTEDPVTCKSCLAEMAHQKKVEGGDAKTD